MKTSPFACLAIALVSLLLSGCAYRGLKREIAEYQPKRLPVQSQTTPELHDPEDQTAAFSAVKGDLETQKKHWQDLLAASETEEHFFIPNPLALEKLQTLSTSARQTADHIANALRLEDLEILTLLRNPAIHAGEARFRAALEAYSQVTGLDEILRQYSAFTAGLMVSTGPMMGKEEVQFPFPGILSLKGEIVTQQARAEWEALQIAIRDRLTMARETFWNLFYNAKAQDITAETLTLFTRLESVARTRYEAGQTSFQDVIRLRIHKKTIAEDLHSLQEGRLPLEARIRESLNLPADADIAAPVITPSPPLELSPEDLFGQAMLHRQEIRQLQAQIGKMERMLTLGETMILPPYTANLSRYSDDAILQTGSGAMKENFMLTITPQRGAGLPKKPWFALGDAYLQQTRQSIAGLRHKLTQTENATRTLVQDSLFAIDRAARERDLYEESIVKLSQVALDVVTKGYESGTISFADVVASYSTWLSANLTLAAKERDFGISRARLEAAIGTTTLSTNNNSLQGDVHE